MENLLTHEQVATLLNVAPQTIRIWTSKGLLPVVKLGGAARYRIEDIQKIQKEGLPRRPVQ